MKTVILLIIFLKISLFPELANRLVGGLSSEKHRWTDSIALFRELEKQLPGDVLLISAFVSYAGAFDKKYRVDLEQNIWIPYVDKLEVSQSSFICFIHCSHACRLISHETWKIHGTWMKKFCTILRLQESQRRSCTKLLF